MSHKNDPANFSCPLPHSGNGRIQLAHGGGGRMMRRLLNERVLPHFKTPNASQPAHDAAVLPLPATQLAFTTDSFVIDPLFFPGGDIGKLAVCGTVNDLAMAGASPLALSCSLILEEGFPLKSLDRILASLAATAQEAGIQIVTGDTKVVEHGKGDGIYINTSGVGKVAPGLNVSPSQIQPGDCLILSGDLGRHAIAIMATRENLEFDGAPQSDCALLHEAALSLATLGPDLHCMRDLTRGGLAATLVELAEDCGFVFSVNANQILVSDPVASACELLGLDPLYCANEGRFLAIVSQTVTNKALELLKRHGVSKAALIIGRVGESTEPGCVEILNAFGGTRLLDLFSGEQMPRIC